MGNKRRNAATAKNPKRSKISKSLKSTWAKRKANKLVPSVVDVVSTDLTVNLLNEEGDLTVNIQEDFDNVLPDLTVGELLGVNPNWCSKQYQKQPTKMNDTNKYGISSDEYDRIQNHQLTLEYDPGEPSPITGNRIVELGFVLDWALELQYKHSKFCTLGRICTKKEIRKSGLVSTIIFNCTVCDKEYRCDTENPERPVSLINTGAVWGTLASGSSHTHMSELLSCMDIPTMSEALFYKLENELGEEWKLSLWKSMELAGTKEREHAREIGNVCEDGMPWITVYVDGSWSKRSYGSNYNALSGMVGIIGRHTDELLFVAVRNKFCCICARAANLNEEPSQHTCYKNWDGSAPAMEADMVVQGFCASTTMHGVKYIKFVADGDSSVFAHIKQQVPYGKDVQKVECTNHALKNYGKHLYKLKKDTQICLPGRKLLTKSKIDLLRKRAKCSIYEHAKTDQDVNMLKKDLQYGLHHVYGDHSNCRVGICNTVGDQTGNLIPSLKSTTMYNHINGALDLLIRKAHLLITNENNNKAERLMNIVARFNMGKRLNLIQRGSYERRVYLSGLRHNKKCDWSSSPWKKVTGQSPGSHFKKFMQTKLRISERKARKRLFPDTTKKTTNLKKRKVATSNTDYGSMAEQPDEDPTFIEDECNRILEGLQVDAAERDRIAKESVGQFGNPIFESERQKRLTASMFGRIVRRRPSTPCHNMVKSCLTQSTFWSEATEYGIAKEGVAIKLFEETLKVSVEKTGLWVDLDYGFLGASPDGLIGEDAILEVKSLYSASQLNVSTMDEVMTIKKNMYLQKSDGQITLKRNHAYYYQVQGQLNITRKSKCYFVVYVNDKVELFIEEIYKDTAFWENEMLPDLIKFYKHCIAPEIVRGNIGKNTICIDPPYIMEAIKAKEEIKKQKEMKKQNKNNSTI